MADALNSEVIDVAQVCTTQPDIVTFNLVVAGRRHGRCSRPRTCAACATQELADAAPADFAETINAINAALTTEALTQLGVEIVVDQTDMADVARTFLEDNGLL